MMNFGYSSFNFMSPFSFGGFGGGFGGFGCGMPMNFGMNGCCDSGFNWGQFAGVSLMTVLPMVGGAVTNRVGKKSAASSGEKGTTEQKIQKEVDTIDNDITKTKEKIAKLEKELMPAGETDFSKVDRSKIKVNAEIKKAYEDANKELKELQNTNVENLKAELEKYRKQKETAEDALKNLSEIKGTGEYDFKKDPDYIKQTDDNNKALKEAEAKIKELEDKLKKINNIKDLEKDVKAKEEEYNKQVKLINKKKAQLEEEEAKLKKLEAQKAEKQKEADNQILDSADDGFKTRLLARDKDVLFDANGDVNPDVEIRKSDLRAWAAKIPNVAYEECKQEKIDEFNALYAAYAKQNDCIVPKDIKQLYEIVNKKTQQTA